MPGRPTESSAVRHEASGGWTAQPTTAAVSPQQMANRAIDERMRETTVTDIAELDHVEQRAVDFYDELGLNRDDSIQQIREALGLQKPEWASKRGRAGEKGQAARERLKLIEAAEIVFADEDSREAYDRSLVRKPTTSIAEDARIDWLGRSWSYYFVQDYGAAGVAARKAREQATDDPMPYVVSAWVNLAEQELRRAKQDVDEAFVLDELGEDTADVQQVRGAVFFEQAVYDRAIQSFDRAYAKSSGAERADLLMRKAWAFEYQEDGEAALSAALEGFALLKALPSEEVSPRIVEGLTEIIMRSADYLAGTLMYPGKTGSEQLPEAQKIITSYRGLLDRVGAGALPPASLDRVTKHIKSRIAVEEIRVRIAQLKSVPEASSGQPGLPIKSLGAGIFCLLLAGVWIGFLLVALACIGFAIYTFVKRSEWGGLMGRYQQAQRDLANATSSWEKKRNAIRVPSAPVPMSIRLGR